MPKSIIFKVDEKLKDQISKKAKKLNLTLSEFMRLVLEGKIDLKPKANPLLSLSGVLSDKETDEMFNNIKKDRRSRK
jgi:antitoxin component of RelBE/YafQ-DinJ toxin-antitoxin module